MGVKTKAQQAAYQRGHYRRKSGYYKAKAKERKAFLIKMLAQYKAGLVCERCEESHPACLDFHHLGEKEACISRAPNRGWSWEKTLAEIAKCEVLCANCHRKLHFAEKVGAASGEEAALIRPPAEFDTRLRHQIELPSSIFASSH